MLKNYTSISLRNSTITSCAMITTGYVFSLGDALEKPPEDIMEGANQNYLEEVLKSIWKKLTKTYQPF